MHLQSLTAALSLGATLTSARVLPANEKPPALMNHSLTSLSGRSPPSPSHLKKRQFGPPNCTNNCFFNLCYARCGSNPATPEEALCLSTCQEQCTLECRIWDANSEQGDYTPPKDPKQPQFKGSQDSASNGAIMEMEVPEDMVHADAEDMKAQVMEFVEQWAGRQQQQKREKDGRQRR